MDFKLGSMLSAVDKYVPGASTKVKVLADKAKAFMDNRTELELKVLEATNHEPWGPHGTVMKEITNAAFQSEGFQQIMGIIDQRLMERNENWRLCYKALLLLEFMIKHGPMRVAEACSSMRMSELDRLAHNFEWKDPATQRDEGVNVRQRARDIVALLTDDRRLQEEREKAAKNQNKYKGMSSGSMGYGGGGGGGGYGSNSSSYDNYGGSSGRSGGFGNSSSFSSSREAGGTTSSPPSISPRPAPAAPAVGLVGVPEEGALDPVEATRRRIAALKAQGALPDGGSGAGSGGGAVEEGGAGLDSPKRPKKKLSDVKVNPAISAALGKTGLLSPPMPGAGSAAGKPAAAGAGTPSAFDLLGDLEGPTPAPAAAAAGAAAKDDDWDAFTAAPGTSSSAAHSQPAAAPAAAAGSDWAAFTSAPAAPAAAPAKRGPLDLDDLLGGPAPNAGRPAGTAAAAAAADPFGDPFAPVKQPPTAAATAAAADPFAASTSLTPGLAPHHHGGAKGSAGGAPKLGPETTKAKDPFADLAVL